MKEEINKALAFLKEGKLILYPTDTIWGIGCDATNYKAVDRIYHLKQRVETKSMIILLDDAGKLHKYVKEVPGITIDLVNSVDSPLTVIYPGAQGLAKNVVASDGTIAIRIVRDEFCRELIRLLGKPLISTSANVSGTIDPITYNQIPAVIKNGVDFIVDHHRDRIVTARASRIIKMENNGEFTVIRK
ncbi:MAG: threonylcarbamoyl-AMP synthase [Bacteroidetes bacterium]|nr:threonylcarbamoyl-AMP synthase [Bacteroidota bacterium]